MIESPPILLLGSTDLTSAVAARLLSVGMSLAGIISPPRDFSISYSPDGVRNTRYVDLREWSLANGVAYFDYINPTDIQTARISTGAVVALVAGWYHMVPEGVRQSFPLGCFGIHASLLPSYRGGAPLNWAILNEEQEAGVSLLELSAGVDDGQIFAQRAFPIDTNDYIEDVVTKAEAITLAMVSDTMPMLLQGLLKGREQEGVPSYSLQRQPIDGAINWTLPAEKIARLVRAVSRPYPGAFTFLAGRRLSIWRAREAPGAPRVFGVCGQIVRLVELPYPAVVTGDGLLMIEEIEGPDDFDIVALGKCHQRRFANVPRPEI